ncbi:hypothetical protein LCM20_06665 [Halobacillus litoralis]|uniref:TIGR04104 family putative zinc finger protein n=1 Tax=Halobacillus litoralis TaxID=45668 RepID=UPI001CD2500F|nr:TIGR04104 family putative zinc finger protein [Halobacillus litoralis]MCA0970264.1 hypothetical protein [Halobacillus litoralis]
MANCQNCGYKWSYSTSLKKTFLRFKRSMECPNCGKKQYQSQQSLKRSSSLTLIPLALLPIAWLLDLEISTAYGLAGFLLLAFVLLHPFTLELSNEEQPLW